jgi:uncharacterized protein (TIGR00255 family)
MINSMTGYGEAQGEVNGVSYAVEIKTVNNRYFKAVIKLPELAAFLEEDIEKLLRTNLSRGTINYVLHLKEVSARVLFDIDEAALQTVIEKLSRVRFSAGVTGTIDVGGLLNLPGVIVPALPGKKMREQIKKTILRISREAVDKLKGMRAAEGAALEADMMKRCKAIERDLERIRARSAAILPEYAKRLRKRVDEMLAQAELKLDEEVLSREVAVFADRSDISEEIARLSSHLQQFATSCQGDGQAGRRLDFISQEMLREANTIASKASDVEIARWVVDVKCQIDRIKEQVQNVE